MKILSSILYGLFIAALLVVAGLFLASLMPIPGTIEIKIVKSGSMEPAIPTGSLVVVRPESSYAVGDIITFGADTKRDIPTTHRVASIRESTPTGGGQMFYTTKGDANEEADAQEVRHSEVIGKVLISVPYAGFVLDFARQPIGFLLLIGIPAGLIILQEMAGIFAEVRRMRKGQRKKDDDPGGGGAPAEKMVEYVRQRIMDEILVPRRRYVVEAARAPQKRRYGMLSLLTAYAVTGSLVFVGAPGTTLSYFADMETSVGNMFTAGAWGGPPGGPPPEIVPDNPICQELGYEFEAKIDPADPGTTTLAVIGFGTTTIVVVADDKTFDWSSTFGIDAVIAKGGPDANVYVYDPPAESFGDTGLHAPINEANDQPFGISHVSFCYDSDEQGLLLAPGSESAIIVEDFPDEEADESSRPRLDDGREEREERDTRERPEPEVLGASVSGNVSTPEESVEEVVEDVIVEKVSVEEQMDEP